MLLEFIKLYEQNPLEIFFSFHYLPKLYYGFKDLDSWWGSLQHGKRPCHTLPMYLAGAKPEHKINNGETIGRAPAR